MKNRIAAIPQYITLLVPLARADGQPDNTALATVAALAEAGFTINRAEVREISHGGGVERTLKVDGLTPDGRGTQWIPALQRAMRALCIGEVEIDEDAYFDELLRKLDNPDTAKRWQSPRTVSVEPVSVRV
ncbi:hypothetical protein [Burkholderia multivorans]|uniref:hypothetical protein n=1 Tax=Burkholderia multivorans TaxID=87883 RepID=UPI00373705CC